MTPVHVPPRPRGYERASQVPTVCGADLAAQTLRSAQGVAEASLESAPSVPADSDAAREYGELGSLWRCAREEIWSDCSQPHAPAARD